MSPDEIRQLPDLRAELNTPVNESPLALMTKRELKILKNSIFAQYGREFKTPWLQKYFDSRTWYKRGSFNDSLLTHTDRRNVGAIMRYETSGDNIPEQNILALGYCEREFMDGGIERFVFKPGNVLAFATESQSAYSLSETENEQTGRWRVNAGTVEYRFEGHDYWEPLEVDAATHSCN